MPLLHPGDTFPQLTLNIPGAQAIQVPRWFAGEFGVLLFNRGRGAPIAPLNCARSSEPVTP